MTITVNYRANCGYSNNRHFKTLTPARKFAQHYVGKTPTLAAYYAVSGDGVGRIMVEGCALQDLFPDLRPSRPWTEWPPAN